MGFFTVIGLVVGLFIGFNLLIFSLTKGLPFILSCGIIIFGGLFSGIFKTLKYIYKTLNDEFTSGGLKP